MRKGLIAAAIIAAATLTATGIGATAASAAATPRCHTADLKIRLKPAAGEVGMMHVGDVLSATNRSHHTCYVDGYAALRLRSAHGTAVHTETQRGSTYFVHDPGPHKVVLKPGRAAVADLEYSHIRQSDTEYAKYLRVTPPGETHYATVALPDRYVWRGRLTVTAFAAHLAF